MNQKVEACNPAARREMAAATAPKHGSWGCDGERGWEELPHYQYVLTDIYFALWIIRQYFLSDFFPQMVSALDTGSSFSWFLHPLLWGFVCFALIFIFWTLPYLLDCKMLQDHLVDLALELAISPRSSSSFYWEWY